MRRKETLLESNLIELGYRMSHKTYSGKHSDKVESYIYKKINGEVVYQVSLNKTREHIDHYSFQTLRQFDYNRGKLEGLYEVLMGLEDELKSVYDFDKKCAKEVLEYEEMDIDNFVEESGFDD